ncbi:MAG: hypothetical protein R3183_06770 [Oleiphilaceae bacterium]|nr:hypothetical protein [Oleiphilaceae bacterium]
MSQSPRCEPSVWQNYRGHELSFLNGPDYRAGLVRCHGELVAYCEVSGEDNAHQHLRRIVDERLGHSQEQSLENFPRSAIQHALQQVISQLSRADKKLMHLHAMSQDGKIALAIAQRWTGLNSSVDLMLAYAQIGRLLYDELQHRPPSQQSARDPYLSSILRTTGNEESTSVLWLQPEVYCALRAINTGNHSRHGYRTAQNFSGGQKHPPLR